MKSRYINGLLLAIILALSLPLPLAAGGKVRPRVSKTKNVPPAVVELDFSFYGQPMHAIGLQPVKVNSVREHDVLKAWQEYQKNRVDNAVLSLQSLSDELGLNDWFKFELVRSYTDRLLSESSPADRVLLEHLLLVNMGYDVRLARTEQQLLLLVPIEQEVYERYFIKIGGKDYYLFYDDLEFNPDEKSVVYPCDPSKKLCGKGQALSLLFKDRPLNISSDQDQLCDFDDGQIHVSCMVNPCVMAMLRNYPLMDMQCYASSVVLPQFRQTILNQLIPQLEGMSQCDAADALLHFVQYVFGYEDDIEYHGQEKINFIEENFYYDKNDCDDRSILYAFLIKALLGLDVQFVHYPGHECTAVRFTDCFTRGYGYYYGDDYYLICDPSYIGATIGRCMPKYRSVQPVVKTFVPTCLSDSEEFNESPLQPRLDNRFILLDLTFGNDPQ